MVLDSDLFDLVPGNAPTASNTFTPLLAKLSLGIGQLVIIVAMICGVPTFIGCVIAIRSVSYSTTPEIFTSSAESHRSCWVIISLLFTDLPV